MSQEDPAGVEQLLIGLVRSLGQLDDGREQYILVGPWEEPDWLRPYLGANQRVVRGPQFLLEPTPNEWAKERFESWARQSRGWF